MTMVDQDPRLAALPKRVANKLITNGHHDDPRGGHVLARLETMVANDIDEVFLVDAAELFAGKGHLLNPDGSTPSATPGGAWLDDRSPTTEPLVERERPQFPIDSLPDWARSYVEAIAGDLQCAVDLPATVALGVISLLASRSGATVATPTNWTEGTNLYLTCALPPGGAKSPVFSRLMAPLDKVQEVLDEQWHEEASRWRAELGRLEQIEKQAKSSASNQSATALERGLHDEAFVSLDQHRRAEPMRQRLSVGDATPEAIIDPLAASKGRLGVMSAEGTLFGAMSRYLDKGADPNIDIYLAGFSGDRYIVDRRSRADPVDIASVRMTICVLTQPEPLYRILGDPLNQARGFSDRFMVSEPASTVGRRRFRHHDAAVSEDMVAGYATDIEHLAAAIGEDRRIRLHPDAWEEFNRWRDDIESQRLGRWAPLAGMPEKTHQAVLRVAALLHMAAGHQGDELDIVTMIDAIELGNYWLHTALAMAVQGADDALERAAMAVLEWAESEDIEEFTLRELYKAGTIRSHGFEGNEEMGSVLDRLKAAGEVEVPESNGHREWWNSSRGKPSPRVRVLCVSERARERAPGTRDTLSTESEPTTADSRESVERVARARVPLDTNSEDTHPSPNSEIQESVKGTRARATRSSWLFGDPSSDEDQGEGET